MIISRSPLRITLGGGGTDIPSYYEQHGGVCIAAAIDKYVYITLHETFVDDLIIKYSQLERVAHASLVKHRIFREALALLEIDGPGLELSSMADIPAGTGLGSSSSFTTALLKALHLYKKQTIQPSELAEEACFIEITKLSEPIGKQDQYIAAHGGVSVLEFSVDGVTVHQARINPDTLAELEDNLLLFFSGYIRSAASILSTAPDVPIDLNLGTVKHIAYQTNQALEIGDLSLFAELLNVQWELKKSRSKIVTNIDIDQWIALGLKNGALGGKLVGAGGGGFLLFYAKDHARLRLAMREAGLREVRFAFDFEGTKIIT